MKRELKILMVIMLFAMSCGGGADDASSGGGYSTGTGAIKAVVTNSRSFDPNISHGQILFYRVTVTGERIGEPVVAEFEGASDSGIVEGIPEGGKAMIKVEAFNPNKMKIREGESADIEVAADEMTDVEVRMDAVPIFANLNDGNSVPNTRFGALIFSEPGSSLIVEDDFDGESVQVFDVSSPGREISPDLTTGLARVVPSLLAPGEHVFTVKDGITGRKTTVKVTITDGTRIKAAPLFSGGSVMAARLGQAVIGAR